MKKILLTYLISTTFLYSQCPPGDVTLTTQAELDNFIATYPTCDTITGDLYIMGTINDLSALNYLVSIEGALVIRDTELTNISNFDSLNAVLNTIEISDNTMLVSVSGFNNIIHLSQLFMITNNQALQVIDGFNAATEVFFDFFIAQNASLETITGFNSLTVAYMIFSIDGNPLLTSIPDFDSLTTVGWTLQIVNTGLTEITGFNNVTTLGGLDPTGGLVLQLNPDLFTVSGFNSLTTIAYDLLIRYNDSLESIIGLSSLSSIGQFFDITDNPSLMSLHGLESLISVSNSAYVGTVVFNLFNNPMLSDCNAICQLLSSNGIIGLTNIADNLTGCNSEVEIDALCNTAPDCTSLSSPMNNDTDVLIFSDIIWNAVSNVTGYSISIGTTSGGTDIADNMDVGNATTYDPPVNLPENTQLFVTIIPYNTIGQATGCMEETFTTEPAPGCANLVSPLYNAMDVLVDTNLTWSASTNTTGYTISIGTAIGSDDILVLTDVGNVTTFDPPVDLPFNTEIHVTIVSYNASGLSTVCGDDMFTTEVPPELNCTILSSPLNADTEVSLSADISWNTVPDATGYIINMGTTSGGVDIANAIDVGNVTAYDPLTDLPENTQIFVTIIPYNASEQASACAVESFTTAISIPDCTALLNPINNATNISMATDILWNSVGNATGYLITLGTSSGGTEIANSIDVGNVTAYNTPADLPESTQIFVSIIPYNVAGDAVGCVEENFTTETISFNIPKFFTPNNDGYHDVWLIEDPENEIATVSIFDRYGKLLKTQSDLRQGWDGLLNDRLLPVNDYWYLIKLHSGKQINGHFALRQ